jgi:hypothetical protein
MSEGPTGIIPEVQAVIDAFEKLPKHAKWVVLQEINARKPKVNPKPPQTAEEFDQRVDEGESPLDWWPDLEFYPLSAPDPETSEN